jgi:N4-gp56 family major capsid protein
MANITSQTLSAPVQQGFSSKLLVTPVPNMIHSVAAVQKRKDRQTGTTERFRRYNPLQPAMAPLGPTGATPPSQNQTVVDIDATISFYGTWVQINEQVTLQNQDPICN